MEFVLELNIPNVVDKYGAFGIANVIEVLQTRGVSKNSRILDIGAYRNAALLALNDLGYADLHGIDPNPDIYNMPFYTQIHYSIGDFTDTHFPNSLFDVCTALSLVEHIPRKLDDFFSECSRILRPGALFLITTNFCPQKIRTNRSKRSEQDWIIFDKRGIHGLIEKAKRHGFALISEQPKVPDKLDCSVSRDGRNYTLVFLAFRLEKEVARKNPKIAIVCPSLQTPQDGISEYSRVLSRRLNIPLCGNIEEVPPSTDEIILETEAALFKTIREFDFDRNRKWFVDCHSINGEMISWLKERKNVTPIVRNANLVRVAETQLLDSQYNRIRKHLARISANTKSSMIESTLKFLAKKYAQFSSPRLKKYVIAPHILYTELTSNQTTHMDHELCIGSFGFAFRFKNFDKIVQLANKLRIKAVIIATINNTSAKAFEESSTVFAELKKYSSHSITIIGNYLDEVEILSLLKVCTHLVFAQDEKNQTSGSMRFANQLEIPIIATDSFQAREAGCLRVDTIEEITKEYLEETRAVKLKMDDGLPYYRAIL